MEETKIMALLKEKRIEKKRTLTIVVKRSGLTAYCATLPI